jgi:uncharacterized protein DUF3224
MSTRTTSAFEVTAWEETAYDEPSEGPKLLRILVGKTFRGEVVGESTAELLASQAEDGSAGYVASERFVGRVGELSGSFVVQHGATSGGATPRTFGHVVPGSGTGELRGLRGEARFEVDLDGGHSFTLVYDFE